MSSSPWWQPTRSSSACWMSPSYTAHFGRFGDFQMSNVFLFLKTYKQFSILSTYQHTHLSLSSATSWWQPTGSGWISQAWRNALTGLMGLTYIWTRHFVFLFFQKRPPPMDVIVMTHENPSPLQHHGDNQLALEDVQSSHPTQTWCLLTFPKLGIVLGVDMKSLKLQRHIFRWTSVLQVRMVHI